METGIIYRAYDSQGKSYVGQTTKGLEWRIKAHYSAINNGTIFHKALLEKGLDEFRWEILEDNISKENLLERERYWAKVFDACKNGYNGKSVNCFPNNGVSDKTRLKMSKARLGKHPWNYGKTSGMKGKHHSEETRKKMSEASIGKPKSELHRQHISEAGKGRPGVKSMLGKHLSEETKRKIRDNSPIKGKHWKLVDGKRMYY